MAKETPDPQREQEILHLSRFANIFSEFPKGALDFGDKPDLIVHTDTGDLGIEHTQLFRVESSPGIVLPQAQERLQERVVARARHLFEERGGGMLWLYVQFSGDDNNALNKHIVDEIALRLADVMVHAVQLPGYKPKDGHWQDLERWDYDLRFPNLFPAQVDQVSFQIVDRPGFVLWGVPRGCFVPEITAHYIQKKIHGKEQKRESYLTRCSEVWLLMVAENGVPSSYFNISPDVAEFTFQSNFDRVFYFENFDSKIIELKIEPARQAV